MYLINHIQRGFYPYNFASDRLLILFVEYIKTNRQTKRDNKKVTAILTAMSFYI